LTSFFLFASGAFVYLRCFPLFGVPYAQLGDSDLFVDDAMRMVEGQVIYRDFAQAILPGTELVYLALFKLFGVRAWIPSALTVALAVALAWASWRISRRILSGALTYVPALLFLVFGYSRVLDPTHHFFSAVAVAGALAVVVEEPSASSIVAGALCGVAAFFTHTRGLVAVVGLSVFLLLRSRRERRPWRESFTGIATLLLGFCVVLGLLCLPFARQVGWHELFNSTVTFLLKYGSRYPGWTFASYGTDAPPAVSWRQLPAWCTWAFIYLLVPGIYGAALLALHRISRQGWQPIHDRLLLLNVFGLALFLGIAKSPGQTRLVADSLPAFILLVWYLDSQNALTCRLLRALVFIALAYAVAIDWPRQPLWLDVPAGRVAFDRNNKADFGDYLWLAEHTQPGEYFLATDRPALYFWFHLRPATPVLVLSTSEFTRPEQVAATIASLERSRVRYVAWDAALEFDPRMSGGDHLQPLRDYLHERYRPLRWFLHDATLWQRVPAVLPPAGLAARRYRRPTSILPPSAR